MENQSIFLATTKTQGMLVRKKFLTLIKKFGGSSHKIVAKSRMCGNNWNNHDFGAITTSSQHKNILPLSSAYGKSRMASTLPNVI